MALLGELNGLDGTRCCCGAHLDFQVCQSNSYYLGYFCNQCGPYSRESGYFPTREMAQSALDHYKIDCRVPANVRDTEYRGKEADFGNSSMSADRYHPYNAPGKE